MSDPINHFGSMMVSFRASRVRLFPKPVFWLRIFAGSCSKLVLTAAVIGLIYKRESTKYQNLTIFNPLEPIQI